MEIALPSAPEKSAAAAARLRRRERFPEEEPSMLSHPPPEEAPDAARLRGAIFQDLDRLAFAMEREVERELEAGREAEAERRQQVRLGVRLAQRLVTGVWADEVDLRVRGCAPEYESRLGREA